jgi:hypothetical protein
LLTAAPLHGRPRPQAVAASRSIKSAQSCAMPAPTRATKITFGEMRAGGVRGLLIYCSDYKCSHSTAISADQWPDHVRLSDLEARFVCKPCGKRGADVRPDFRSKRWATGDFRFDRGEGCQRSGGSQQPSLRKDQRPITCTALLFCVCPSSAGKTTCKHFRRRTRVPASGICLCKY